MQQIRYLPLSGGDLKATHAALDAFDLEHQAVNQELARHLCQFGPEQGVGCCNAARHVSQRYVSHIG